LESTAVLSRLLAESFELLDEVVADLTAEQYNWQPPGTSNAIARLHAHTLASADFWVNVMALRAAPLWPEIARKAGLPENALKIWDVTEPIALADMTDYGTRLAERMLPAVEGLGSDELSRELDTPYFGRRDVAFVLRLAARQLSLHTGEISAAKGAQGLKGLPF
jgi:hypothetical protein